MVGETNLEPYPSGIKRYESHLAMRIIFDATQELRKLPPCPRCFVQDLSEVDCQTGMCLSMSVGGPPSHR